MTAPVRGTLYLAFGFSGAAALLYESLWSRYLGLLLGHSAFAQVLVLTVFLGGMAVGSAVTAWRSPTLRSPLFVYAGVELVVGILGLAFHDAFGIVSRALYDQVFPHFGDSPALLAAIKSAAAALLILPQSILLGATFPLMSAGVVRATPRRSGGILGWLYASNSLGAAVGVLVAGFYLTGRFGLPGTLIVGGILNTLAGILAFGIHTHLSRAPVGVPPAQSANPAPEIGDTAADSKLRTLLLLVAGGTAVASFAYEIAWIRMLSLVLGSATHSFELMLSAFILGLGLGALWIGLRGDRIRNPTRALVIVQCVMGAMAAATLPLYVASFGWIAELLVVFTRTAEGYIGFTMARYAICLIIMLPATVCAGMTLPLVTRILYRAGARESAIGEVYGANTAGSIVGVQLASLVLPALGLKLLLVGAALTDIALGVALLPIAGVTGRRARLLAAVPVAAVLVVIAGAWLSPFEQRVMHSGVFRTGRLQNPNDWVMMFHRDGRTATVTVRRSKEGLVVLATNGKPDASLSGSWFRASAAVSAGSPGSARPMLHNDDETQLLLPLVAMAHRPHAQSVAVIGHGSGISSHVLLSAPDARRVTTIEIEPEIVRASMVFFPFNRRVFEDPRSRIVLEDARAFFAGATEPFDLIISEPSNPWVSGVSGLFTKEFYAAVRRHLAPNGVFAQWLHLYEMNDALVRTVLAAVQSAFPVYDVYVVGDGDIAVIATAGDSLAPPDWSVAQNAALREELDHVAPLTADVLGTLYVASSSLLAPFVTTAAPNSDYTPVLDLEAERARFLGTTAAGFRTLNSISFDFARALSNRRVPLAGGLTPAIEAPRFHLRAMSARLRAGAPRDSVIRDSTMFAAFQRRHGHDAMVASGSRTPNWQLWTQRLALIDRDIHAGSAGAIDTALFAPLGAYLRRANAPTAARNAVQFLRSMNSWDFAAAAAVSDDLVLRQLQGENWIPALYLRDAAVTAKLMTNDPRGALRILIEMQRFTPSDAIGAFRTQLLMAQIVGALRGERK